MLAMLLFASTPAYADDPPAGESNVTMTVCATGTTQVRVIVSDGSRLNVNAHGATDAHLHFTVSDGSWIDVGTQGTADARMDFTAAADTVMDIHITGDGEADIDVSGPCQVNVRVEGPSQVHINAGDEVRLSVEASDESQVFLDDHSLDNPAQKPDEPAQGSVVPVISGVFPAAGLLAFFLIRRRAKNKVKNERR